VEIVLPASSERADARAKRRIRLIGLWPAESEKIGLLASILEWEIEPAYWPGAARRWPGAFPDAFCTDAAAGLQDAAGMRPEDAAETLRTAEAALRSAGDALRSAADALTEWMAPDVEAPGEETPDGEAPDEEAPDAAGDGRCGASAGAGRADFSDSDWGRGVWPQRLPAVDGGGAVAATQADRPCAEVPDDPPRLVLHQVDNVIRVQASSAVVMAQLARLGLDRLVLPLSLLALEELLVFAG
jgi:hypothetical protein